MFYLTKATNMSAEIKCDQKQFEERTILFQASMDGDATIPKISDCTAGEIWLYLCRNGFTVDGVVAQLG